MKTINIEKMPTNEEIVKLIEEGIKDKAFALVISYQISGAIGKKSIKYEYAFSKEEKEHLEEINSDNWRRIEKIYNLPTIKDIAESIVKQNR